MASILHNASKMMKIVHLALITVFLASLSDAQAQRRGGSQQERLSWGTGISVDGFLEDWGDTLLYLHPAQHLQYQLKNDGEFLYVAMRTHDYDRQIQALSQGFSIMVNQSGRKREGPRLIFPITDRISYREIMARDNDERPEDMRLGALESIRAIVIANFDDILDGQISLDNNYDIRAVARIDSADALCVEAKIPLERLGLSVGGSKNYAFNVRINGIIMPTNNASQGMRRGYPYGGGYGYPYGGYGYPYGGQQASRPREETGVWVISALATP